MELFSDECFFQTHKEAKTEQVAQYFQELATYLHRQGYRQMHLFLDNNTTHLVKMRTLVQEQTKELGLSVYFHYFPKYSPKLNVVEYLIHLIRQKWLHHADYRQRLKTVEEKLTQHLHQKTWLPKQKITNILQYIQDLILKT